MVMLVGLCYVIELTTAPPGVSGDAYTFLPRVDRGRAAIADATVVSHSLFLRSSLVRKRGRKEVRIAVDGW
jgi:Mn2+/Fe2+ NRAMP family transporter